MLLLLGGMGLFVPTVEAGTQCGASITNSSVLDSDFVDDDYDDFEPTILNDGNNTWITIWQHRSVGSLYSTYQYSYVLAKRSTNNGASWSSPFWLSWGSSSQFYFADTPYMATNKSGTWIAVWNELHTDNNVNQGRDIVYARSTDNGKTWSEPTVMNSTPVSPDYSFNVSDIAYGKGTWIVTGTRLHRGHQQVFYFRSVNNGASWSGPYYPAQPTNLEAASVKIATNGKGAWALAWWTYDSCAFCDHEIWTSHSGDNGNTWSKVVVPGFQQRALLPIDDVVYSPATNEWFIVWTSDADLRNPGSYVAKSNIIFSKSRNNGASWSKAAWLVGDENSIWDAGGSKLHVDSKGNVAAVWLYDNYPGSGSWVYQRCQKDQQIPWGSASDINKDMQAGNVIIETPPSIASNKDGDLIAAWSTKNTPSGSPTSDWDIYLSKAAIPEKDPLRLCVPCVMMLLH